MRRRYLAFDTNAYSQIWYVPNLEAAFKGLQDMVSLNRDALTEKILEGRADFHR